MASVYLELGKLPASALLGLTNRLRGEVVHVESRVVVGRQVTGEHQVLGIPSQLKVESLVYSTHTTPHTPHTHTTHTHTT
jgi:hypothetical protein